MQFDDKVISFLIQIINLYNPKAKGLLSKPIMSYQDKKKFIAVFSAGLSSKQYRVGTEPETLAGALASAQVIANNVGDDYDEMIIQLFDTSNDSIITFMLKDGEFAVIVGDNYSSKKENSTFRIA